MDQDNRVLVRRGARELTPRELDHVAGGIQTMTICSIDESGFKDGDVGEC